MRAVDLAALHVAVAAVCPIDGVSVNNDTDRSTWLFRAQATATAAQRTAAQGAINSFDISAAAMDTRDRLLQVDDLATQLKKWILDIDNRVEVLRGNSIKTAAQLRAYIGNL